VKISSHGNYKTKCSVSLELWSDTELINRNTFVMGEQNEQHASEMSTKLAYCYHALLRQ